MKNKSPIRMIRLFLISISFALANNLSSQNPSLRVFEEWTAPGGYLTFHQKNRTITDGSGNVYVTGTTLNAFGNYDMLTAKYSSTGSLLWQQNYAGVGGGDDGAADVAVDGSGNVYITGSYYKNSTDSNNAITIKYNSSGVQQWMQEYNGAGSRQDGTVRIQIDGLFVYVVGSTYSGTTDQYDFLAIKYDFLGNQSWASVWDNAGLMDGAVKLRVKNALVTVAGGSQVNSTQYKYAVVNFDVLTGLAINSFTTGGNQPIALDQVNDLTIDNSGNIYITGGVQNTGTGYDIRTVKLNQSNLSVAWTATYNGSSNADDKGNAIVLDASGNVYVTGFETVTGQGKNYVTIKYASNNGAVQWTTIYNDPDNGDDEAVALGVEGTSRVYVTGYAFNGSTLDYYTIGYDASNGNLIWEIGYNGLANKDDRAADLSVLGNGELIVTGTAFENPIKAKYVTVKYVEKETWLPDDTIPGTSNSFAFIQNNGQLWGSDSATHPEVKFYSITGSPNVYFMDTAVAYVFAKIDTSVNQNDSTRRVDMKFVNANADLKIRPLEAEDAYSNYFLGHIPEGRSRVQQYEQLVSFNVWNNVDIVFGTNYKGLKYYFIGQPGGGGNPMGQIDLKYEGADSVKIGASGELIIYTKLGAIVQPKAAAWQLDANGNYSSLGWQPSYSILGTNEVGFTSFGAFNATLPIIIAIDWGPDSPQNIANISWSTFFGDGLFSLFNDIRTSNSGEIVVTGTTTSTTFPTLTNIFALPQGGRDAVVVKFHANGALYWSTYYGGANEEYGNGVDVDVTTGNIFVVGETRSYNFPTVAWGAAELNGPPANATNPEQFIIQLSQNGMTPVWATCYGGTGLDAANDIRISNSGVNSGDIYVVGKGTTSFPQYSQPAWADGNGTILRFDDDGVLLMATRFGSSGGGELHDVTIDADGDVVVVGWVPSGTGVPIQNAGGNSSYGGGVADGVICKFSGANASIWWCTYFGGNDNDAALSIETFKTPSSHFYYVSGRTLSTSGLPVVNPGYGYYQGSSGGSNDAFVVQISSWGYFMWSTYYGGSGSDYGWSIAADPSQNVYLLGETHSSNLPFPATNLASGYVDGTLGGASDGFVVCFRKITNDQIWTTYLGGGNEDMIYSGTCFGNNYLYITGMTNRHSAFPLDNGGGTPYYDGSTASGIDGFITQFEIDEIVANVGHQIVKDSLHIYPNPADQTLYIATGCENCETKIVIQDVLGQTVLAENNTSSPALITIDVGMLASGSYIVSVQTGDSVSNVKLIIQH
jgi:hypothetical protein